MKGTKTGRRIIRILLPRGVFALSRAVISVVLVLLVTQQLLFLRTEDVQFTSSEPAGFGSSIHYVARKTGVFRQEMPRAHRSGSAMLVRALGGPDQGSSLQDVDRPFAEERNDPALLSVKQTSRQIKMEIPKGQALHAGKTGAKRVWECFSTAKSYLSVASEFQDDTMAERVKFEMDRCLGMLEAISDGSLEDDALHGVPDDNALELSKRKKRVHKDASDAVMRLKSKLEAAERQTKSVILQSMMYSQMAAKSIPQGLHCLALRLTMAWNAHPELESRLEFAEEALHNHELYHYALFSDNVIAVAVVVNSTAQHLREPWKHVFHIVTDRMNYGAMRAWFALNPPRGGMALEIRCLDEYPWVNSSYVPVLKQIETEAMKNYYFKPAVGKTGTPEREDYMDLKYRNPKYLSILNHLRFYLPQIFPYLNKVLFLDDDVVIQKDLSPLWEIPMEGKVNLAVETCGKVFHRFKTYLNFSSPLLEDYDPEGCGWAFGMNMFDLKEWRAGNFTDRYHFWQHQNENRELWRLGTLPPGLLTFYNSTKPLDRSWQVLGLGSKSTVPSESIEEAAVIHYNGHAKPWLELAIPAYQHYWTRYVPYDNVMFHMCNIRSP